LAKKPNVHSEVYFQALNAGIIKEITEPDGNVYFDYNLFDKTVGSVVSLEGLVMVEGAIYQYTGNAIKIITDSDFNCIDKLKNKNEFYNNKNLIVIVYEDENRKLKSTMDVSHQHVWSQNSGWKNVTKKM